MNIDITTKPPIDIFQHRGKYLWISIVLLSLVVCGLLLMGYGVISDTPHSEKLETAALILFVGPGLIFVYFGGKLRDYKRLGPVQKKELADFCRKYPEISTYCALVGKEGRAPIWAEYEACRDWVEDLSNKKAEAEHAKKKMK